MDFTLILHLRKIIRTSCKLSCHKQIARTKVQSILAARIWQPVVQ